MAGLRKQADFLLVFPTRKLEQPAYEAKQMTTAKAVGAASGMRMRTGAKRVFVQVTIRNSESLPRLSRGV